MQTVAKPNPASPNADPRDSSLPIRATAMNPPTKIMPTPNTWRTTEYQSKKLKHSYTLTAASDRIRNAAWNSEGLPQRLPSNVVNYARRCAIGQPERRSTRAALDRGAAIEQPDDRGKYR